MALAEPTTLGAPPLDLPWTLDGGRGLFGLPPIQGALLLWAALMGFTLLFVICAAVLSRWQWGRLNRAEARAAAVEFHIELTPAERARLRREAGELIRQAAATAAAAKHAKALVLDTRAKRDAAQQAREAAWHAFDAAQRAYEEALREAGAQAATAAHGDEDEDGKRAMARAALTAFRRGDITVEELRKVFQQASGWDPVQELQAREVELRRSAESRARRLYQAAAAAERTAVEAADVAEVAAQALAEEAVEVAEDARTVRDELAAAMASRHARPAPPRKQGAKPKAGRVPSQRGKRTGHPQVSSV